MASRIRHEGRKDEQYDDLDTIIARLDTLVTNLNAMVNALTSVATDSWQVQTP